MDEKEGRIEDIAKRYNLDLKKLEREQEKLAKSLETKDSRDFSEIAKIGGLSNVFFENKIISAIVVVDSEMNVIEQKYFSDKVKFPYLPGFRAYRELPAMVNCFNLLDEKPEIIFIPGHGILHQRLGLASHFSLVTQVPSIGVSDSLVIGEVKGDDVLIDKKAAGKVLNIKPGARALYISPGNLVSVKTAYELAKKFVRLPHKLPEPMHIAHKYAREVMKEVKGS